MLQGIESVAMDEKYPGVLVVTDLNGARRTYLEHEGTWIPGRVWTAIGPGNEQVTLFLPFMDGTPSVLQVTQL